MVLSYPNSRSQPNLWVIKSPFHYFDKKKVLYHNEQKKAYNRYLRNKVALMKTNSCIFKLDVDKMKFVNLIRPEIRWICICVASNEAFSALPYPKYAHTQTQAHTQTHPHTRIYTNTYTSRIHNTHAYTHTHTHTTFLITWIFSFLTKFWMNI